MPGLGPGIHELLPRQGQRRPTTHELLSAHPLRVARLTSRPFDTRQASTTFRQRPNRSLTPISVPLATISGDAVEQQGGEGQPSRLIYTTRIRLEKDTMNVDGRDVRLSPGMVAAVEIKTGTRKLIEYVLSPLMRMGDEAGRER